ncbi:N-acetylneuraminate synthase family protein [Thalassospiraceae bacterium LMO-JJ14]|nr:N-acetylneuraminate synthase family protein [Thalassospiraceae bacterium LMO-JJ14]
MDVAPFIIGTREVGPDVAPLVIAEIGINHEGSFDKAIQMVDDAAAAGCECAKFQCHVIEDEMIRNDVIPGNAKESIWDIMDRCKLTPEEDKKLMDYVQSKGMIYLSTPFSRAAADLLESMDVPAYKIGSGECNNYPLLEHIASFGKPVILSTGMNGLDAIDRSVEIFRSRNVPVCILQCTSMYPTPYDQVHLRALDELKQRYDTKLVGLSDHSLGIHTCIAATALGACILEKHFTSDKTWPGPDVPISIDPAELAELIAGSRAVHMAMGGGKKVHEGEAPTIAFAYASVVSIRPVRKGEAFSMDNLWVKRPGTGEILAEHFKDILGKVATRDINSDEQISWTDIQ